MTEMTERLNKVEYFYSGRAVDNKELEHIRNLHKRLEVNVFAPILFEKMNRFNVYIDVDPLNC